MSNLTMRRTQAADLLVARPFLFSKTMKGREVIGGIRMMGWNEQQRVSP